MLDLVECSDILLLLRYFLLVHIILLLNIDQLTDALTQIGVLFANMLERTVVLIILL